MAESIRVLYVDDDRRSLETRSAFLEEDDRIEVVTEASAADGLARLAQGDVDCVLCDHDMPGTDGLELLAAVRAEHPRLPVILFSGTERRETIETALAADATDFVPKSSVAITYDLLTNRIANAVDHHRARRRLERLERDGAGRETGDTQEPRA